MTIVILLNGPAGSGKSTLANEFERCTPGAVQLGFSWYVKVQALMEHFGVNAELAAGHMQWIEDNELKDEPYAGTSSTPRQLYLTKGEELRAQYGTEFIPNKWLAAAGKLLDAPYIIVPDCRCVEEVWAAYTLVGKHRTLIVQVARPGVHWEDVDDFGTWLTTGKCVNNVGTVASALAQLNMHVRTFEDATV